MMQASGLHPLQPDTGGISRRELEAQVYTQLDMSQSPEGSACHFKHHQTRGYRIPRFKSQSPEGSACHFKKSRIVRPFRLWRKVAITRRLCVSFQVSNSECLHQPEWCVAITRRLCVSFQVCFGGAETP